MTVTLFTTDVFGDRNAEVRLGGADCETCGYNEDRVEVCFEPATGVFDVKYHVGCYGYEAITSVTADQAATFIRELADRWHEHEEVLKQLATETLALAS